MFLHLAQWTFSKNRFSSCDKIHELVKEGVDVFVKNKIFDGGSLPDKTNRRFFPRRSDIWSYIYRASIQSRLSPQDQGNLALLVKQWTEENPEDKFIYQPYRETKDFNVYDENTNLIDQIGPPAATLFTGRKTKGVFCTDTHKTFACLMQPGG